MPGSSIALQYMLALSLPLLTVSVSLTKCHSKYYGLIKKQYEKKDAKPLDFATVEAMLLRNSGGYATSQECTRPRYERGQGLLSTYL